MSTQAVSSLSIYQELQSFYQSRRTDLQALGTALQSGDLNGAQQAYNQLVSLGQSGPFANTEPFAQTNRAQDFGAIGQALSSGDLAGAQAAFAALQQTFAHANSSATPAFIVTISTAQATSSAQESIYQQQRDFRNQRAADLQQLGQALSSGDLNAVQQAYNALVQLGQNGPFGNGQPFQRADRARDFAAIGQAIQSGDLGAAQQAFSTLQSTFHANNHGGTEPPTFAGGTTAPPITPPVVTAPPVSGGTTPPIEPPAFAPPTNTPPIVTAPPTGGTTPPASVGTTAGALPEIIINIGGAGTTPPQSGSGSELVLNLPAPGSTPEEVQINLASSNGPEQITVEVAQAQSSSGNSFEQIAINLAQTPNENIVLNLFGSSSASQSNSSGSLNVQG